MQTGEIEARVIAPVPWFPSTHAAFGSYASMARTPEHETRGGLSVAHPRYALPPLVGMTMAPLLLALGALPAARRLMSGGFDFDLIDAHYFYPDGVAAALLAKWLRRPYTITARGSDLNLISRFRAPRAMMRWAAGGAAANITVSAALANVATSLGIERASVHVLRNGVDADVFIPIDRRQARAELGVSGEPVILSVGHLVDVKRHDVAIKALASLVATYPGAQLAIVGEGPKRRDLEDLAARLGVGGRVIFVGARPQNELPQWYSAADCLILASEREGWPNVVLEAIACGTPVVASRVGGLPEILSLPDLGIMVEPRNTDDYAVALHEVLERPPNRQALRRHAESMGWQSTSLALVKLFRRTVDAARRS